MKKKLFLLAIIVALASAALSQTPRPKAPEQARTDVCTPDAVLSGDLGYTGTECRGCSMTGKHIQGEPDIEFDGEPVLTGITKGGPADGKLEEGDVLVAVDGEPITTRAGAMRLSWLKPGESVRLTIRRQGTLVDVEIITAARCRRVDRSRQQVLSDLLTMRRSSVAPSETRGWLGMGVHASGPSGTFPEVIYVAPGGPAEKAGIKQGDSIVSVDGVPFEALRGSALMRDLKPNQQVTLQLIRNATPVSVTMTAGRRP